MWYGRGLAFYTKEEIWANSPKEKTYGAYEGEQSQIWEFLLMPKITKSQRDRREQCKGERERREGGKNGKGKGEEG